MADATARSVSLSSLMAGTGSSVGEKTGFIEERSSGMARLAGTTRLERLKSHMSRVIVDSCP